MTTVTVLNRDDWGASADYPRRGYLIGPQRRTEVFIHHTVITDDDDSPNEWDSLDEVRRRMRVLQTIRPDLGRDVPYSMVAFCMTDGDLVLCEGRGLARTGAHTENHNRSAIGIALQGNFDDNLPRHLDSQLEALGRWLAGLRSQGFTNLGSVRPAGREVWAHRDVKSTRCPGERLMAKLGLIRFVDDEEDNEMAMDKATWKIVQQALQAQDPPLYAGKTIDGIPGRNTDIALQAFERRMKLTPRGVMGTSNDPEAGIWPASREMLFVLAAPRD